MTINPFTFRTPTLKRVPSKAGRLYELPDGRLVPGVTTALEVINKPLLVPWAAKLERLACLSAAAEAFAQVEDSDLVATGDGGVSHELAPRFRELMEERLGTLKAHQKATEKAANIGTETHAAIERWIRERLGQSVGPMPQLSEPALLAYMAFTEWAETVKFQPLAAEVMVYDPWQGYAGTLDFVARLEGVLTVGDWKTGKAIYTEAFLQNAAYVSALRKQCRLGDEPIQGVIVRFPKALEDVKAQPFEVKLIKPEEQRTHLIAFLKAKDLWLHLHPEVPPLAVKAPTRPTAPRPQRWSPPVKPANPSNAGAAFRR